MMWYGSLDMAITRYAVKAESWRQTGGVPPDLKAFLCGWFAFRVFEEMPNPPHFRDSFRAGWAEAEVMGQM